MLGSSLTAGAVIASRYRLDQELGRGGMGVVWAATHKVTERAVALKFLHGPAHLQGQLRQRFLREARAASAVRHPNVVEVLNVFELEDGTPVMVMERLFGETLGQRLSRSKARAHEAAAAALLTTAAEDGVVRSGERLPRALGLSLEETAAFLVPVVSAVGAAHANGIVHRDLKPENLFIDTLAGSERIKVLDFGVAKLVEADGGSDTTETGSILGTPCYMAPEQALGEKSIDHRADVWALGVILYECLSGVRPIEGDSAAQVLLRIVNEGIRPLARVVDALPPEVNALVTRMLERERERRPADLREVLSLLQRYTPLSAPTFGAAAERRESDPAPRPASEPPAVNALAKTERVSQTAAGHELPGARPAAKSGRPRSVALLLVLLVLFAALGGGAWLLTRLRVAKIDPQKAAPAAAPLASMTAPSLTARMLTSLPVDNPIRELALLPDGLHFVYADTSGYWLSSLSGGAPRRLKHLDRPLAASPIAIVPDGRTIAVLQEVASDPTHEAVELVFIPFEGGRERVLPISGAGAVRVLRGASALAFSPDGRELAIGARGGLLAVDTKSGRTRLVSAVPAFDKIEAIDWAPDGSHLAFVSGSFASAPAGLVVVGADGAGQQRLLVDARLKSQRSGAAVAWPDQHRLLFSRLNEVLETPGGGLWELELDDRYAARGAPRSLRRWERRFPSQLSFSHSTRKLIALMSATQGDVVVGELGDAARKLDNLTRLTLHEADDRPSGWHQDGRVLFMSDRYGSWDVLAQAPGNVEAELLAGSPKWETRAGMLGRSVAFWRFDPNPELDARRAELIALEAPGRERRVLEEPMETAIFREAAPPPISVKFECVRVDQPVCVLGRANEETYALHRFDATSGRLTEPIYERATSGMPGWTVAPDARSVALVAQDAAGLVLISLLNGEAREIKLEAGLWQSAHWLPDGGALMLTGMQVRNHTYVIARVDLRGKIDLLHWSESTWFTEALPSPDGKRLAFGTLSYERNAELIEGW